MLMIREAMFVARNVIFLEYIIVRGFGLMSGQMDQWIDGWMNGLMDGRID